MYTFEKSITIDRSPQDVFNFVTNPANNALWQSGTESAEWTSDDPPGIGATFKTVVNFMGRKIEADVEITRWDPPNLYGFKTDDGPFPIVGKSRFEPKDNGTELILEAQIHSVGFFKLVEGLVGKWAEKQDDNHYAVLKLLLEADQARPPLERGRSL